MVGLWWKVSCTNVGLSCCCRSHPPTCCSYRFPLSLQQGSKYSSNMLEVGAVDEWRVSLYNLHDLGYILSISNRNLKLCDKRRVAPWVLVVWQNFFPILCEKLVSAVTQIPSQWHQSLPCRLPILWPHLYKCTRKVNKEHDFLNQYLTFRILGWRQECLFFLQLANKLYT